MKFEKRYVGIAYAAAEAGIAQIRIWELIRNHLISIEYIHQTVFIEMSELEQYLAANPVKHDNWRQNYAHAQTNKLLF